MTLTPKGELLSSFLGGSGSYSPFGVDGDGVPLVLFLVLAGLFVVLGVYLLARPGRAAALFADRDARHAFRPRDARFVGLVFVIAGGGLLAVGIVRLAVIVTS